MTAALRNLKDWAPLPARLVLGTIFIAHGSQKLFGAFGGHGWAGTAGMLDQLGVHPAAFWAFWLILAEFFGGLGVLVGLLTRLASIGIAIDMCVAIALVHGKNGFFLSNRGFEFPLVLLGVAISLLFSGAGKLSLDALFAGPGRSD